MDSFHDIIDKYNCKIGTNIVNSFVELEQLILEDKVFKKLDEDEQSIVLDVIKEKFNNKSKMSEKVEINVENTNNHNKQQESSMYKFKPKPIYEFAGKNEINIKAIVTEKKPFRFNSNYKVINNTDIAKRIYIDPSDISEGALLSSIDKAIFIEPVSEELYLKRKIQYEFVRNIESPEQRTPPWFAQRNKSITASDCGCVLSENKHEPLYNFVFKKVFGSTFGTNIFCYHGKKFENVVTLMYELVNDVIVEEFGLLGHPVYNFLAASPDGICAPYCRDKVTPSPLVGRMIEIKCPFQRKIKYSGDIKGEICPDYYWCQVQLQLECCDLDECDFVQCNIEEYRTRQDYLDDTNTDCDYKSKTYGIERGVVIELMPTKLPDEDYYDYTIKKETKDGNVFDKYYGIKDDAVYDKASFIYQPKLDMTMKELDEWIIQEMDKLSTKKNVKLNRIIYWRFIERNCTLIKRDKVWFNKNLETMRKIWSYVEILRTNNKLAEEWKNWIDAQNKKFNDKIMNKLVEIIKNAGLFEQVLSAIKEISPEMTKDIDNFINIPIKDIKSNYNENNQEEIKINVSSPIENVVLETNELICSGKVEVIEQDTKIKKIYKSVLVDEDILNDNFNNQLTIDVKTDTNETVKEKSKKIPKEPKKPKEPKEKKERKTKKR
jgi:putative phage-type endonuclease